MTASVGAALEARGVYHIYREGNVRTVALRGAEVILWRCGLIQNFADSAGSCADVVAQIVKRRRLAEDAFDAFIQSAADEFRRTNAFPRGGLIKATPADGMSIGADTGSRVGDYNDAQYWTGKLRDVRYHRGALTEQELRAWAKRPE